MAKVPKITLCWNAKTDPNNNKSWRYFIPIFEKHHGAIQVKHGWVKDKGQLVEYPNGRYVLRSRRDGKRVYTSLDTCNPTFAVVELQKARRAALGADDTQRRLAVLKNAATAYIDDCKARDAMGAYRDAKLVLGEFVPLCKYITHTRSITRKDVLNYHKWLRAKGNSARTIWNKHNRLLSFLRFAKGDLTVMPPKPTYQKGLPDNYTPKQTAAILAAADDYMRLVILMGLKLGLRELEIVYAEWSDVHWEDCVFRVTGKPHWKWKIKDAEMRDIPLPADVLKSLKARHKKHPKTKLIVGTRNDKPNLHLLRTLKRLAKRADLNCGKCKGCNSKYEECERWQLHRLRRTYATTLLKNNVDVRTVQAWCGWADLKTALRYLRPSAAKESQDKVNAVDWSK
jgi:integrase